MKQSITKSIPILIPILIITLILLPLSAGAQNHVKSTGKAIIPEDVRTIFNNACMDCHSEGGNKMAMAHVNFSKWDKYSPEKQAKKSIEIFKEMAKGKMPPRAYISARPEFGPTKAQIDLVNNWSQSIQIKK
jgi:hypothetical protein